MVNILEGEKVKLGAYLDAERQNFKNDLLQFQEKINSLKAIQSLYINEKE